MSLYLPPSALWKPIRPILLIARVCVSTVRDARRHLPFAVERLDGA
jgi:hypothetical protein